MGAHHHWYQSRITVLDCQIQLIFVRHTWRFFYEAVWPGTGLFFCSGTGSDILLCGLLCQPTPIVPDENFHAFVTTYSAVPTFSSPVSLSSLLIYLYHRMFMSSQIISPSTLKRRCLVVGAPTHVLQSYRLQSNPLPAGACRRPHRWFTSSALRPPVALQRDRVSLFLPLTLRAAADIHRS